MDSSCATQPHDGGSTRDVHKDDPLHVRGQDGWAHASPTDE